MGGWWLVWSLFASAAELGLAIGADGDPVDDVSQPMLSLDVEGVSLSDFVALVAAQTGLSILVLADVPANATVTTRLQGVAWDVALPELLAGHGLTLEPRGRGWVVVPLP